MQVEILSMTDTGLPLALFFIVSLEGLFTRSLSNKRIFFGEKAENVHFFEKILFSIRDKWYHFSKNDKFLQQKRLYIFLERTR